VLATREVQSDNPVTIFYSLFGKKSACNIDGNSKAYLCDIIYGTTLSFQGGFLHKIFKKNKAFFLNREFDMQHICLLD